MHDVQEIADPLEHDESVMVNMNMRLDQVMTVTSLTSGASRGDSLAAALKKASSPVDLLRNLDYDPQPNIMKPEFTNWRSEQQAWERTCVLFDQTNSMNDLLVSGPDARVLLEQLGINSFANFTPSRAMQFIAVAPNGHIVGDAVLFNLDGAVYDLTGHTLVMDWVQFHAEATGLDLSLERDGNATVRTDAPPRFYRYELQGPNAVALLEQACGSPIPSAKFFHVSTLRIAGKRVGALRHGMAGQDGFELYGPYADREFVLSALLNAGADHGLVRGGRKAYSTANLASGWVPAPLPAVYDDDPLSCAYRDWLPLSAVGPIGGSSDSPDITDYYLSPYDLGYDRFVSFNHDFVGRDALERLASEATRTKVTLIWNPDDVASAMRSVLTPGSLGAKFMDLPKIRYSLHQQDKVLVGDRQVGISLDCGYLANHRSVVSLATIDRSLAQPGTEVVVLWGEEPNSRKGQVEEHVQVPIRAVVAPAPLDGFARSEYRAR